MATKKLGPFDILNSINSGSKGKDILDGVKADNQSMVDPDSPEKAYVPFMINRGLSYFQDTVLFANEMNQASHLPARMQYDFLKNIIRPRKRFSKWFKEIPTSADLQIIMKHYGYNKTRAQEAYSLMPTEEIEKLHKLYDKGGKK